MGNKNGPGKESIDDVFRRIMRQNRKALDILSKQ